MPFQIAIPSYKRPGTLVKKTLKMLAKESVPSDLITIFLASEDEKAAYAAVCDLKLVVGLPGINHQRRFIEEYYPVGTKVVSIDDDISQIKMLHKIPLMDAIEKCFDFCEREGCYMWGVSPTSHTLSMKDEYIVGRRYIIASFHGMIIREPILPLSPSPFYEDFWRTLEAYKRDGKLIRFGGISPVTRYFIEPGGLQEFRTQEAQHAAFVDFAQRFPDFCWLRVRPGRYTDAVIKRTVSGRVAKPFVEGS
jgi:hypothetical protein